MTDGHINMWGQALRVKDVDSSGRATLGVTIIPGTVPGDGVQGGTLLSSRVTFTRPGDATPYSSNDAVANSTSSPAALTFDNLARINAGTGFVVGAEVTHEVAGQIPRFRLHLFNASPTPYNDNAALALTYAIVSAASYLGYIDFEAASTLAGTDFSKTQNWDVRLPFVCGAASKALYGLLQTLDAFTPGNAKGVTVKLWADAN